MARRAQTDAARDLLLAVAALRHGLIDADQLLAAFDSWTSSDDDRPMAEILAGQGALDDSGLARLERLARQDRGNPEGDREKAPGSRSSDGPSSHEVVPRGDPGLSATVAHLGSLPSPQPSVDPEHTTGSAGGPAPATAATPSHHERFQIIRPYARGGLGEVFLALDPDLVRQVALKEILADRAHDPLSQSRFLREAQITGRLEHPGIVPVYGLGRHADGRPYYAMRFIEGETLGQAIERFHRSAATARPPVEREIAFRRLLRSLIDACNAVAYAHSRGVVHRDLKPENIMLGPFGETLVVDWGLAKPWTDPTTVDPTDGPSPGQAVDPDDSSLTRPGSALGTPQYMSPEQAAGAQDRVGPASDVYSLGATFYCLLVGHGPFPTGGVADVLRRVRRGIFPGPRRLRRSIDAALEATCLKAMAVEPGNRHATPLALAEEIEAWLADVRYRGEQEQALHDVKRSLARLCIERAHNLFARAMPGEGMLWLARALESVPPDSPSLERVVRASLGGWHAGVKLMERVLPHRDVVHAVTFSPDGRRLATACADRTARLWDIATGSPLSSPMSHEGPVRAVAFSPDGRFLATASDDGSLRLWDSLSGAPTVGPIRHHAPITAVRFAPDGSKVATASSARIPCLYETTSGLPVGATGEQDAAILAIGFNPAGTILAAAGDDGRVWLWETATGQPLGSPLRHEAAVPALDFRPDGRSLLTGCRDGRARLWDLDRRVPLVELTHGAEVGLVAFNPGGRSFATACADRTARIWDAGTGRPIGEPLPHRAEVTRLAFNPEGTVVATGSHDGTVRLWDADTGLALGPPLEHRGAVHDLAFNPDGRRLATAGSDAMARYWRVPVPIAGDCERITCWVRAETELDFDEGDAIRRLDQLAIWEHRRRLQELGGAPVQ